MLMECLQNKLPTYFNSFKFINTIIKYIFPCQFGIRDTVLFHRFAHTEWEIDYIEF